MFVASRRQQILIMSQAASYRPVVAAALYAANSVATDSAVAVDAGYTSFR